jgi:hypothetical protein
MDFWFEFLNIDIKEITTTCHDFHGFKWQNIYIYPSLILFFYGQTPFLVRWIMIAPIHQDYCIPLTCV